MKKLFTILLASCSFSLFSQASPTIEATYLPVVGTTVKQVWDIVPNHIPVPATGANVVWNYSNKFTGVRRNDTFPILTLTPSATPYGQYFPNATHATFLTAPPEMGVLDSLYSYLRIDQTGLYNVGGFSEKYDSLFITNPAEKYVTPTVTYGDTNIDTSRFIGYANNYQTPFGPYNVKIHEFKRKDVRVIGYGTLAVPNATYNNVLLAREIITQKDSIFPETNPGSGVYTTNAFTVIPQDFIAYYFLRNNTFGTSYLMYLNAANTATVASYGYYNIPVDTGFISGTVFTDLSETLTVTHGEAYLYRENSNFAKHDILARVPLNASGNYVFNAIPYGKYRVAIRADTFYYPNSFITYNNDNTDWSTPPITTFGIPSSVNHNIHLQWQAPAGLGQISGNILSNLSIMRVLQAPPVKGIGVVVKKKPSNGASRAVITDNNGGFDIPDLDNGDYELFVDIPGLQMADTYTFNITGSNSVNCLDYAVGTNLIHPTCGLVTTTNKQKNIDNTVLTAYPNPYLSATTIAVKVTEASNVSLEVYNLLGEKVQALDNAQKQKGSYNYSFSAKQQGLSAGVYIVKLQVNDKLSTIKLIEQ